MSDNHTDLYYNNDPTQERAVSPGDTGDATHEFAGRTVALLAERFAGDQPVASNAWILDDPESPMLVYWDPDERYSGKPHINFRLAQEIGLEPEELAEIVCLDHAMRLADQDHDAAIAKNARYAGAANLSMGVGLGFLAFMTGENVVNGQPIADPYTNGVGIFTALSAGLALYFNQRKYPVEPGVPVPTGAIDMDTCAAALLSAAKKMHRYVGNSLEQGQPIALFPSPDDAVTAHKLLAPHAGRTS